MHAEPERVETSIPVLVPAEIGERLLHGFALPLLGSHRGERREHVGGNVRAVVVEGHLRTPHERRPRSVAVLQLIEPPYPEPDGFVLRRYAQDAEGSQSVRGVVHVRPSRGSGPGPSPRRRRGGKEGRAELVLQKPFPHLLALGYGPVGLVVGKNGLRRIEVLQVAVDRPGAIRSLASANERQRLLDYVVGANVGGGE